MKWMDRLRERWRRMWMKKLPVSYERCDVREINPDAEQDCDVLGITEDRARVLYKRVQELCEKYPNKRIAAATEFGATHPNELLLMAYMQVFVMEKSGTRAVKVMEITLDELPPGLRDLFGL